MLNSGNHWETIFPETQIRDLRKQRHEERRYEEGEEMQEFQAQHREKVQQRATALGLNIEEAP
jgi:hypothetical protein